MEQPSFPDLSSPVRSAAGPAAEAAEAKTSDMVENLRILIVDDEAGMRAAVKRALDGFSCSIPEMEGEVRFLVEQAASGEEALERLAAEAPDILLLDHKLDGMSGLDVLAELENRELDLLTVMITAYASLETAVTATKRGAFDFLAKPFTPEELRATVRKTAKHLLLQRAARRLVQEKRQIRFQFISVLVHELKAPLAAIHGYLNIMQSRAMGEEIGPYDSAINRSLIRLEGMRKLILDLLDLTYLETGQKKRELVPLDLREVARKAMETASPDAAERQIEIRLAPGDAVPFTADAAEMEIIFNNLVTNAVKYNRESGRVDLTVGAADGKVTIRVADTGIGMTSEERSRLFGEFVRIKNNKTRGILGSGLGLSIVKKLALAYQGGVTVESEPDVGSVFTVVLSPVEVDGGRPE
jgi:two-component system, sensor histidine kinase and response regulator